MLKKKNRVKHFDQERGFYGSRVKQEPNSRAKYMQRGREISMGKAERNINEMQREIYIQYRDLTRGYRVMKIEKGGG
jgi:hypothetical protein